MKCVCGYFHLEDWEIKDQPELESTNGKEKFESFSLVGTGEVYHPRGSFSGAVEKTFHICPVCGTVQCKKWC